MAVGRPIKLTPNVARKTVSINATADQTTFTPTGGYRIGDLAVYRNGVRLVNGRDYTAVDGANVILQSGATVDDVLEFGIFDSFNIANAINKNGNQAMGGDLTVGLTTMYSGTTGIVSTGELRATTLYGDGSNLTGVAGAAVTAYIDSVNLTASGIVSFTNATDSTSSTSGAVIISGGVGIAKSLFVGNNVTIGGTLTYADVTNIDSVGIITAQTGVIVTAGRGLQVTAGGLNVTAGVGTFKGILDADAEVTAAGGVDVAGGVKVGAALTVVGALDVDGVTTLDAVTIAEEVTASGGVDITGGLKVGAASTLAAVTATTGTFSGNVDIADTIYHTGDSNTKIRFPSNDTITAATSGSERVRIDSSGNVGINTESLRAKFDVRGGVTLGGGQLAEKFAISSTALNSATDIDLDEGMVHYRSANLGAANVKPNITSSVGINTALKIGEAISVTIIPAVNSSSNYVNALAIDHADVTENWVGGSAPSDGGGSGVDIYAFNILKTANNTYVVVGNQTKTSS